VALAGGELGEAQALNTVLHDAMTPTTVSSRSARTSDGSAGVSRVSMRRPATMRVGSTSPSASEAGASTGCAVSNRFTW
jgi:hypothetical protein